VQWASSSPHCRNCCSSVQGSSRFTCTAASRVPAGPRRKRITFRSQPSGTYRWCSPEGLVLYVSNDLG
jgi:hypothetical protein